MAAAAHLNARLPTQPEEMGENNTDTTMSGWKVKQTFGLIVNASPDNGILTVSYMLFLGIICSLS